MVESYKDVTIGERRFRIRKLDARTGGFILFKVAGILAPLVQKIDFGKLKDVKNPEEVDLNDFDLGGILAELGNIPESDFNYLQEKCLRVTYELLPAGETAVLNADGTFGVIGLEHDTMTVLALTVHALIFNLKGFFSGSPLASMAGGLLSTFRPGS